MWSRRLLSSDRSLPCDIAYLASKVPIARAEMSVDLADVADVRTRAKRRISWATIYLKAFGCVSDGMEVLRQSYFRWPVAHVLQHSRSVAMVAIQREHQGRARLCWGRIIDPGQQSLSDIQIQLDAYTTKPVDEAFRKQLRLSKLPWPIRRAAWAVTLNSTGRTRERQVGTFSMSSLAGQGVNNRDHPTICTSSLTYGPLDASSHSLVTLVYDHRMMDGMQAAQALQRLRSCLQTEIVNELQQLARQRAA